VLRSRTCGNTSGGKGKGKGNNRSYGGGYSTDGGGSTSWHWGSVLVWGRGGPLSPKV
jgi:hypothetical protein